MTWNVNDPQALESLKIRWELVPYTRQQTLDIGVGQYKPFSHFIGIDNYRDASQYGHTIKADMSMDAEDLCLIADQCMDSVFSSHLLEHIEHYKKALREWWRVLKVDGYLILYLPHRDLYPHIGEYGANPDHKHDFLPEDIVKAMVPIGSWDLVRNEVRDKDREYSFFQVYKKLRGSYHLYSHSKPRHPKRAGVVRYGAIGDLLQASSVFAGLKKQGFHVTLHTSPPGDQVILHDPNIDEIVLQGKDQVPNPELGAFWKTLEAKYDRFVNLSESVEGSLLALPGRTPSDWAPLARHKLCNRNYLEQSHDLAGVPHEPRVRFYPTTGEQIWAKNWREKSKAEYLVMWVLAGSGVHKTWAYVDFVIAAALLHHPGTHFLLVGDDWCRVLEGKSWDNEPRVHCESGKLKVRETLALLDAVDCVIGPETGVLNGASQMHIPKIVFLSHSTHENLTRDWVNTYPLSAEEVHCKGRGKNEAPACHLLHYSWASCTKDLDPECDGCKAASCTIHTSTAVCQAAIKPDRVSEILFRLVDEHHARRQLLVA